jgi:DNA (cytosine-5)-methyltransferase 1
MTQQIELFDLLHKRLWRQPIRLIELFGGIGSQHKALSRLGVPISEHYLVEIDADATISYAAIHCDLHSHLNDEVPSKEEMIAYLQPLNWWKNEKPLNLERYGKLKELYLAQRLTNNLGDLNQLDDLPQADFITWSTPCQDFSNAGNKAGFTGHKGSLTHATVELFQKMSHKPTFLLFENVPMIVSETFRDGFDDVFRQIADLGYENILLKLNAKHYGIPQNRDRIFVLSIRKGYEANYSKPKPIDLKLRLKDMLEDEVNASFYLSKKQLLSLTSTENRNGYIRSDKFNPHDESSKYAFSITTKISASPSDNFIQQPLIANPINSMEYDGFKELSPTLKARDYKDPKWVYTPQSDVGVVVGIAQRGRENGQEFELNGGEFANAITTVQKDSMIYNDLHIRKLTPRETWRLMGFDDSDFDKASAIHSNST